jgi:hypothetical protein
VAPASLWVVFGRAFGRIGGANPCPSGQRATRNPMLPVELSGVLELRAATR